MSEKMKLNLVSGKASSTGKSYIYVDELGTTYISKEKFPEGIAEYFVSYSENEYQGKKQTTNWIAKEEYKPKEGKFPPKKPDQVAMFKEAMVLVSEFINLSLIPKPKTTEELKKVILAEFEWIKSVIK